ncbi:MAG TPA: methyltransferase domain-containing protein [Smithella sp.]|nr:methyltransferase domain-containing protein [Smithella sp.]
MSIRKYQIKWPIVLIISLIVAALFFWESKNLKIETDILESMPQNEPVLSDARQIIRLLPIQDRIFIDLGHESADKDKLVKAAVIVSGKLSHSGLFTKVGFADDAKNFPELIAHVNNNLPSLLSASNLEQKIAPLLKPEKIKATMAQNRRSLEQLEGIGRSDMITKDPLGFSGLILGQLSALLPANKAQFYQGQLISEDGKHALIIARIAGSGTDTATAAKIEKTIEDCERELKADKSLKEDKYTLTSAGAYRAALDNETIAKRDTRLAIILTTLGIALLLIFAFPRPLVGLLALLPSTVGAIAALFVCSFLFKSISMLAIGFGGAIMGFTVDLGITYLLFLDQPYETYGRKITRTVWSAELLAVLTTVGSFLLLLISDFKILAEIGVFTALGVFFALIFVLFVFPIIFPKMPAATRQSNPLLLNAIKKIASPAKWKLTAAVILGFIMLLFAWPKFNVDLNAMNSISQKTVEAGNTLQAWGDFSGKCYVFLEAKSIDELQNKNDQLMNWLSADVRQEKLSPVFLPSVLFPSARTARSNFSAWREFWNKQRVAALRRDLDEAARESGFKPEAFAPFWKIINQKNPGTFEIPERYYEMMGIAKSSTGFTQLSLLSTGKNYDAEDFFSRLIPTGLAKLFDVGLFNKRMGDFLKNIFIQIAIIIGIGTMLIVFIYYLDWLISLAVLAPIAFALIATLGTLKLIGHPLDIPGIMLWIVIMGMGINYSIYYACFYQRYRDESSPEMDIVKLAMFLASFTTLIGFGVLAFASHALMKSIGITSLLGVGYSILGAFFILPVLMKKIFAPVTYACGSFTVGSREHLRRTVLRYRHLTAYTRIFARMKMMIDPMFKELNQYVQNPKRIIDIGCGYGIPATWLLEIYPEAKVYGLEPDEERVRIASYAIGSRGRVEIGGAPDLPRVEGLVDYVIMLDMLHLISDQEVQIVFRRIYDKLETGGTILIRATIPSERKVPWKRWIEATRLKIVGMGNRFRPESEIAGFMTAAGFNARIYTSPTEGVEEKWFVGKKL